MPFNDTSWVIDPEKETQIFARSCAQCSSGLNKGYLLNDSDTFCSKECVKEYWNIDDNNIDSHISEAIDGDWLYWTEWEELDSLDDYVWYTKDGSEGDIESLIPVLFSKYLKGASEYFDDAVSLLSELTKSDSNVPLNIELTGDNDIDFSNIINTLSSLDFKPNYIKNIIDLKSTSEQLVDFPEDFFLWTADNIVVPVGVFNNVDDARNEVGDVLHNWVANNESMIRLMKDAKNVIVDNEPDMWYGLSIDGSISKIGIYESLDAASDDNQDDIIYYMNTEALNDFIIQIPVHHAKAKPSITASLNTGFKVDESDKRFEVEIKDDEGKLISEFFDTKYEADHRIGWIKKLDTSSWDDVGSYDMGPTKYIALTAHGFQSIGSFVEGQRSEYDENGNKIIIFPEDVADLEFGDGNWSFISPEYESRHQAETLKAIIDTSIETKTTSDLSNGAEYVVFDTNGDMLPLYNTGTFAEALEYAEVVCAANASTFVEVVGIDHANDVWAKDLEGILAPPEYKEEQPLGLDFYLSELTPEQIAQWIETIATAPKPKKVQDVSFLDEYDMVDEVDGREYKIKISFSDQIEVNVNSSTSDVYDKLIWILQDTVINKDLTAFDFFSSKDFTSLSTHKDNTEIYDIFLEYLQDVVNTRDVTAFEFHEVKVVNENPHFIVNDDYTLSCVDNADVACEEHTHGWFDTEKNAVMALPALRKIKKSTTLKNLDDMITNEMPF